MPGPQGVSRAAIIALLAEGHSNNQIGRILRTNPKRAARIRTEEGLPAASRRTTIAVEQRWQALTLPAASGHLGWAGHRRGGQTPMFMHYGHNYSARRVAFLIANGREPQGRVLAGCDWPPCVAPAHMEDARMRALYAAVLGAAS